ncbi:MAG TPA: eight-cysteine-cluster domain-containing protein [Candidatus Nanoarchaeia archaeon]|nr:eight-cysteine-cluster domain-containing protein [Candidatus Nanoarchaeia archaeon]
MKKLLLITLASLLLIACEQAGITNFEECVAAGNPVMESYPRQCSANGQTFVEDISGDSQAKCEAVEGTWLDQYKECEYISEADCTSLGGSFQECASACRHDPTAEICTMQCVPVCSLNNSQTYDNVKPREVNCLAEQRSAEVCPTLHDPVCGWFDPKQIQCIKYPCAQTYNNICEACLDSKVLSWTSGDCPLSLIELAPYFQQQMNTQSIEEIGQPIEGFEPEMYMQVYPGIKKSDFDGVKAELGTYYYQNGNLNFVLDDANPIHSAARAITLGGIMTLLNHVSERIMGGVNSKEDIDNLLFNLQQAPIGGNLMCDSDSDCLRSGCSGTICQPKDAEPIYTTCEYKAEYACYDEINCACINNRCWWDKTSLFEQCVQEAQDNEDVII